MPIMNGKEEIMKIKDMISKKEIDNILIISSSSD